MKKRKDKEYLTSLEIADLLMVTTATVRQWAQKGKLPAQITPGGHRRFYIKDVEHFAASMGIDIHARKGNKETRILVVDDDSGMRNLVVEFLENEIEGVLVDSASNGFEAGQKIVQFEPIIAIIDVMMPGINGVEVCKLVRANPDLRNIKIIAMTGYFSDSNVSAVMDAGADVCLKKPLDFDELRNVLDIRATDN
ncbi:MAG: response regulator [Gammaproteobacteria bacterium]